MLFKLARQVEACCESPPCLPPFAPECRHFPPPPPPPAIPPLFFLFHVVCGCQPSEAARRSPQPSCWQPAPHWHLPSHVQPPDRCRLASHPFHGTVLFDSAKAIPCKTSSPLPPCLPTLFVRAVRFCPLHTRVLSLFRGRLGSQPSSPPCLSPLRLACWHPLPPTLHPCPVPLIAADLVDVPSLK